MSEKDSTSTSASRGRFNASVSLDELHGRKGSLRPLRARYGAKPGRRSPNAGGGASARSRGAMRTASLAGTPQAVMKITGFGKGAKAHVRSHLEYISRTDAKSRAQGLDPVAIENEAGERSEGKSVARDTINDWGDQIASTGKGRNERLSMHMMISAPPGTDEKLFADIARAFGERAFGERRYVFAIHLDVDHPHAHFVVPLRDEDGRKLNPRKADLQRYREQYAEVATSLGLPLAATRWYEHGKEKPPRERTHPTTYHMLRRGEASEVLKDEVKKALKQPTKPMIKAAEKIAKEKGVEVPAEAFGNIAAMRGFLDKHGKQRSRRVLDESKALHVEQAKAYRAAGKDALAQLHDAAAKAEPKSRSQVLAAELESAPTKPPTAKMVALAEAVAAVRGLELPETARTDWNVAREFLNQHTRSEKPGPTKAPPENERER